LAEAPASFGPALSAETPASTGTLALAPAPERRVWSPLDRFDDPGAKPVAAACPVKSRRPVPLKSGWDR